jgi:two-component system, NtrC family, sensor kinase
LRTHRDDSHDPEYSFTEALTLAEIRTQLGVPLMREGSLIGTINLCRRRVEPFTEKQIALLSTVADQAVIAIENARVFEELRDRQAELRVTFDNMGDGVVMFGADMRLVSWNRNFQEILDLSDDFLAQRPSYSEYLRAQRGEYSADLEAELSRKGSGRRLRIEAEGGNTDARVEVRIRNNGTGIPPDIREKIFNQFFTTGPAGEGTGSGCP